MNAVLCHPPHFAPSGIDEYIVPDLLRPGLKLIFCGSAPSRISAAAQAYYANPQNRFWRTLHETGITPHLFAPPDYPHLLDLGIGLTDLCKTAFGNDDDLPPGAFDIAALRRKIELYRPGIVGFTSKTVGRTVCGSRAGFGWQPEKIGDTRLCILPSTSPRARSNWTSVHWQDLASAYAACL